MGRGLQGDIARQDHHRHTAPAKRFADGDLEHARHLLGFGDKFAIMAALLEEHFRVRFLEIAGADLGRRDLRGNREHGHARAMAIEETVDQMEIARPATARADGEFVRQMCFGARCESGNLFVPNMDPLDFSLPAERVGQTV